MTITVHGQPRSNLAATDSPSASRPALNRAAGRANWHTRVEVIDEDYSLVAATANPTTLVDALTLEADSAAIEVTLPEIAPAGGTDQDGRVVWIDVVDADGSEDVTLTPSGSDTVAGGASQVITAPTRGGLRAHSADSNWSWFTGGP